MPVTEVRKRACYSNSGMVRALAATSPRQFGNARKILDVGCGTGAFARHCPSDDIEVHGVDIDARAIEEAARFEVVCRADLDRSPLPYEDETFDAVLAKDIVEHVLDAGGLMGEIFRVMRPGAVLVVSTVMARPRAVWADYTHIRGFTKRSARLLLEDAGFEVEAMWRMGGVPLSARLRFVPLVPHLLLLPVANQLCASSWELRARKRP